MIRFDGQRAVVWGLGRHGGGVAVTKYLAKRGADVLVIDNASEAELSQSIQQLDRVDNVTVATDHSLLDGRERHVDLLVVNPAIPATHDDLARWRTRHPSAVVTSEINLLLAELHARKIEFVAVTGSNGKTSVCQWLTRLLAHSGRWEHVFLGGNFEPGLCVECECNLLERFANESTTIVMPAIAVLELSSFQLATCDIDLLSPLVGAVTNVSPNHLDWHDSFDDYMAAKGRLVEACQAAERPSVLPISSEDPLRRRYDDTRLAVIPTTGELSRQLLGVDATNAATVTSIGRTLGCKWTAEDLLATHPAVPHRREPVGESDGVQFVNDSASTTPASTIALLASLNAHSNARVGLIAGGRNKGFDLSTFASHISPFVEAVACIGETALDLSYHLARTGSSSSVHTSLDDAVKVLRARSNSLDVIALSPGMASTDMFRDYRDRGDRFRQIVRQLSQIESNDHPID